MDYSVIWSDQGAETSCVCVCIKRVCVKFTEPKACTVGYRLLQVYIQCIRISVFSLGEYICLLLIVYLKISLIYM